MAKKITFGALTSPIEDDDDFKNTVLRDILDMSAAACASSNSSFKDEPIFTSSLKHSAIEQLDGQFEFEV